MRKRQMPPALILCCVDYRYIDAALRFVKKQLGVNAYDVKTDAGGTKALLNGDPSVRAWILSNVKLAYHRHGVRTVVLVHHEDCAAYGGSSAFKDGAEETACHAQQLAMAASLLRASFQRLTVRMFYAYRARSRIVFAEIVGSRPRHRTARPVGTRGGRRWMVERTGSWTHCGMI